MKSLKMMHHKELEWDLNPNIAIFFSRSGYSPSSWTPCEKVGGEPINVWIGWCRRLWWHKSNSSTRTIWWVFFQCRPGFIHPEILSKQLVNRWESLFWRKQLVYPRRKRWPLGSALRVSLLCQICSFPSGFIVCGSGARDFLRTKSNLSFVKQNRPELFKGQAQQVQEIARALRRTVFFYRRTVGFLCSVCWL